MDADTRKLALIAATMVVTVVAVLLYQKLTEDEPRSGLSEEIRSHLDELERSRERTDFEGVDCNAIEDDLEAINCHLAQSPDEGPYTPGQERVARENCRDAGMEVGEEITREEGQRCLDYLLEQDGDSVP